ncbi:MAG TPA: YetF domain-containing protein [Casimicrobiaceae bacterium]|nr:YetF domain-containing protein [Casimicrobiaceae bacterium]
MPDFAQLFELTVNPMELFIRGTCIYLGLVLLFRFALQRDLIGLGVADFLFIALLADAAQNAMAGDYRTITDGAVLLGTLAFWNGVMIYATYHWRWARRLLEPPARELIRDGRIVRANLKREWITVDELMSQLRAKGIEDIASVKLAVLESSGEMAVLQKEGDKKSTDAAKQAPKRTGLGK